MGQDSSTTNCFVKKFYKKKYKKALLYPSSTISPLAAQHTPNPDS